MTDSPSVITHIHGPLTFGDMDMLLKVGNATSPQALSAAICRAVQEGRHPVMRAIGHGAIGQAVKGLILARGLAAPLGLDLCFIPGFENVLNEEGVELSAVVFRVLWR